MLNSVHYTPDLSCESFPRPIAVKEIVRIKRGYGGGETPVPRPNRPFGCYWLKLSQATAIALHGKAR